MIATRRSFSSFREAGDRMPSPEFGASARRASSVALSLRERDAVMATRLS
jgi:hypothetical protein